MEIDLLKHYEEQSRLVCLRQHLIEVTIRVCLLTIQLKRLAFFDLNDTRVKIGFLFLSLLVADFSLLK